MIVEPGKTEPLARPALEGMGIGARLDAEQRRDLIGAYLDAASVAVTEMGGQSKTTTTTLVAK